MITIQETRKYPGTDEVVSDHDAFLMDMDETRWTEQFFWERLEVNFCRAKMLHYMETHHVKKIEK